MRLPNSVPEMNVMDDGCSLYFCTLMMSLYVSCGLFISASPKILSVMKYAKFVETTPIPAPTNVSCAQWRLCLIRSICDAVAVAYPPMLIQGLWWPNSRCNIVAPT